MKLLEGKNRTFDLPATAVLLFLRFQNAEMHFSNIFCEAAHFIKAAKEKISAAGSHCLHMRFFTFMLRSSIKR